MKNYLNILDFCRVVGNVIRELIMWPDAKVGVATQSDNHGGGYHKRHGKMPRVADCINGMSAVGAAPTDCSLPRWGLQPGVNLTAGLPFLGPLRIL